MMLRTKLAQILAWIGLIEPPQVLVAKSLEMPAPEDLPTGWAIIVGPASRPKWVTFQCPSGCKEPLLLSLNPDRRPRWTVTFDWLGRPSINPSIRRPDGCRSHFWIRKGQVEWCKDTGGIFSEN